jgi:hypothetical protein
MQVLLVSRRWSVYRVRKPRGVATPGEYSHSGDRIKMMPDEDRRRQWT